MLRIAIIGCGAIAAKHLTALEANSDDYELVAVCDTNLSRAQSLAGSYADTLGRGEPAVYESVGALLQESKVEVVSIATPSAFHADAIVKSLEAGAHVIAEKPLALSTGDLDRIQQVAAKTSRLVTACYVTRFSPHVRLLTRALNEGRLGRVLHIGLSIYWNRNEEYYQQAPWRGTWETDGGALMNQCTHGVDLMQHIAGGEPTSVRAELRRFSRPIEAEDFGAAIVSFDNGVLATFTGTVAVEPTSLGTFMTVVGSKGTVQLGGKGLNEVTAWQVPGGHDDEEDRMLSADYGSLEWHSGHAGVYEDFALALKDGRKPRVSLSDARTSVDLVLAMYKSMKCGTDVSLPVSFATTDMANVSLKLYGVESAVNRSMG